MKLKIEKKQVDLDKKKSSDNISRLLNELAQENYKLQSLDRSGEEIQQKIERLYQLINQDIFKHINP